MKRNASRAKPTANIRNMDLITVSPKTENQKRVLNCKTNLIIHGYAGTGKSFLGLNNALRSLKVRPNVKIIRSAVATRDIGHLPGSYEEKIEKYEAPYVDIVNKLYNCGTAYETLKKNGTITFDTTSYVRGGNWDNCTVVVDECQNMTFHELDSVITRLEDNATIYFLGDCKQADLRSNGFGEFISKIDKMPPEHFEHIEMTIDDIVRGKMMRDYIIAKTQ